MTLQRARRRSTESVLSHPVRRGGTLFGAACRRGLHAFIGHLASGVVLVLGLECLALTEVDWYGTVRLLHSFFSVPVSPYSTDQRLFSFIRKLPSEGLPPVVEIPGYDFAVRHAIRAGS